MTNKEGNNNLGRPKDCPKITVIICTLNEEQSLPHVLPKVPDWIDEIILVDGHSTDNTITVAKQLRPEIKVFLQQDTGKGNAMRYGTQQATGEIIVMLDADGSTDPTQIPDFIKPLIDGYDFVKGSRFLKTQPVMSSLRRFGNKLFATLTNILYGSNYTDVCAGLNAFWVKTIKEIDPEVKEPMWEPTFNIKLKKRGVKVIEVSQRDNGRIAGKCEASPLRQGLRVLRIIILERFRD